MSYYHDAAKGVSRIQEKFIKQLKYVSKELSIINQILNTQCNQ